MTRPGLVMIDRDGVINEDSDEFIKSVAEWRPIRGSLEAIAALHRGGWTIAVVTNQSGVGRGLYDSDSAIALRVFSRRHDRAIDGELIAERVKAALALRNRLVEVDKLGCIRLINGEADGLPGIVVERYNEYLITQLFTSAVGIERLWEISQPLLDNPPPVRPYKQGTWGPNQIHQLIAPYTWRLPFERPWRERKF